VAVSSTVGVSVGWLRMTSVGVVVGTGDALQPRRSAKTSEMTNNIKLRCMW
jgi:hypothetical protein